MVARDAPPGGAGQPKAPRNPISRRQIETVVSRSAAIFGLVFGAQTYPVLLEQAGQMAAWSIVVDVAIFGGLLIAVVASFIKRLVRVVNSAIAISWLIAMATWPLAVADPNRVADERPWLWFLCTVATAAAAVAWPVWVATVALILAPVTYGVVRMTPSGGAAGLDKATFDVVYAIILGGAVLLIITLLRQAAASVDLAQSTALDRYSNAVRQHATEVERVQVDSIVHDSVLTTLLSAARAFTPEAKKLATRMAKNAMGYLHDAAMSSPDDAARVTLREVATRIRSATRTLPATFESRSGRVGEGDISASAAEAIYSAAVQSMVNSAQHAGDGESVTRWLAIHGSPNGIVVEVGDTGAGFDVHAVPTARIGLRVSIVERVSSAGGRVDIDSAPGEGTVITITWPDERPEDADALDRLEFPVEIVENNEVAS